MNQDKFRILATIQPLLFIVVFWFAQHLRAGAAPGIEFNFTARENTNLVLHNPDMGWVLYENYPVDDSPNGSSTMLTMPGDSFPEVDAVALMFSWADVEVSEGSFDFSRVDRAYDYWRARGKEIQLRLSTEPLMLHVPGEPLAGTGPPKYLFDELAPNQMQTRHMDGETYTTVDARVPLYQRRLKAFLRAIDSHFDGGRPVTLIDLRGFGAWGEWHSGFRYESLDARRQALKTIIDAWCGALPHRRLLLSYSYDPDGPPEFYSGSTEKFDAAFTTHYPEFLRYSAFDYALKNPNISFRRDGCGGAIHSNERKLNEEAFFRFHRAPMFAEFLGAYSAAKRGGSNWVTFMVKDALSQHPNYLNLIGWQSGDARLFSTERPDLLALGSGRMGYRFVPINVKCRSRGLAGRLVEIEITWVNRGVGRALRNCDVEIALFDDRTSKQVSRSSQRVPTNRWIQGGYYPVRHRFSTPASANYRVCLKMTEPDSGRMIELPLAERGDDGYLLGSLLVWRQ